MNLTPGPAPERVTLEGQRITVAPLDPSLHFDSLYRHSNGAGADTLWRYLFDGPFPDAASFRDHLDRKAETRDPIAFALVPHGSHEAEGYASLMRVETKHRVIEVGSILLTPPLQRTPAATEAMYLLARYVFEDLQYRRYEWKCDTRNEPSRRAALRLGFTFEGTFRQHMIVKGQSRDTAWFAMLDGEWPVCKAAFEEWLRPDNFDSAGQQKKSLAELRASIASSYAGRTGSAGT